MVVVLAGVCGAVVWACVRGPLVAPDGSSGLSLMSAGVGVFAAVVLVAVAGLPALGLGVFVSAMGNPLSGLFAVSVGLGTLAALGGSSEGWMLRANLPGGYGDLMVEMLIWQAGVVVMVGVIQWLRSPVHARWPALAYGDHLGMDLHLRWPAVQAWSACAVCSVCGGVVGYLLIRTHDTGEVLGMLFFAFTVGAVVAGVVFPGVNPVGILFAPAVVALVSYAYMLSYSSAKQVLAAWYDQSLSGLALALPIHYVSAGIAGCCVGVGLAQVIEAGKAGGGQP